MFAKLVNPNTGAQKICKIGWSWTTWLFGLLVPLFRGDFKFFFLFLLLLPFNLFLWLPNLWVSFSYNRWYIQGLLDKGWEPFDNVAELTLVQSGFQVAQKYTGNAASSPTDYAAADNFSDSVTPVDSKPIEIGENNYQANEPAQTVAARAFAISGMSGFYAGQNITIPPEGLIFGRDASSCSVLFESSSVSRRHARLYGTGTDSLILEDLGSTNGTYVLSGSQWQKITSPVTLSIFKRFRIGDQENEFEIR